MTASVRFVTFSALRTAVTWFLTVGSAKSSIRPIALLLLPCIIRANTSICLSVKPRSRGDVGVLPAVAVNCPGCARAAGAWRSQNFGRNVDPSGKNQTDGAHQNRPLSGFRNEPQSTKLERADDVGTIVVTGKHHDRYRGIALAEFGKDLKTVAVRQVEVEEDERQVRMLGDEPHRLLRVRRFHDGRLRAQLPEDAAQQLADQNMIVDNKDLHAGVIPSEARGKVHHSWDQGTTLPEASASKTHCPATTSLRRLSTAGRCSQDGQLIHSLATRRQTRGNT